jgi:hypothetical protein
MHFDSTGFIKPLLSANVTSERRKIRKSEKKELIEG